MKLDKGYARACCSDPTLSCDSMRRKQRFVGNAVSEMVLRFGMCPTSSGALLL
jgi:hypothetical protein